jgi:hypothetical protein
MAIKELQGDRHTCETVGELLEALEHVAPSVRCCGGLEDPLEVTLWKDKHTGELSLEIEEAM